MDWDDRAAPSLEDFDRLARAAFEALPAGFRARCDGVLVAVADFAEDDVLDELGIEDPFELTGLYQGVELTRKTTWDLPTEPDTVWLYRRPILDEWCERGNVGLAEIISHVLVHEIGHHFGLSDAEIEAIEARAGDD